jgi:hypothetical protein
MVVFFSGNDGTSWWNNGTGTAATFLSRLRADGFWTVQVEWMDAWVLSAPGEDSGSGHVACRPATVVRGVHDSLYMPLGLHSAPLACGFCITGNSGGSAQVSYPLSFYGLDSILDAVIPTSGPTHAAEAKGCLRNVGEEHYAYSDTESITIDDSFGFDRQPGACFDHDPSLTARWNEESVDTGANDLFYPTTRVQIIVGAKDCGGTPAHAADFYNAVVAAQSPSVALNVIQIMGHSIQDSSKGLGALENALLGLPVPNGTPCYQLTGGPS